VNTVETAAKIVNLASPTSWALDPNGNAQLASTLWNGVSTSFQKDPSKFLGNATVFVGSFFVGAGEVDAATVLNDASKATQVAQDATKIADTAGEVTAATQTGSDILRTQGVVEDAAAANSTRAALDALTVKPFEPLGNPALESMSAADKRAYLEEYAKQLAGQQDALNSMTVDEFLSARAAFKAGNRNPLAANAQADFAADFEATVRNNILQSNLNAGMAPAEAEAGAAQQASTIRSTLAALHEPDMVAGGWANPSPTRMGLSNVNSAIGASWPSRIGTIDRWAQAASDNGFGNSLINVKLPIKGSY
jgi:filamentous hemagglutinin